MESFRNFTKVYWDEIKHEVKQSNPEFFFLVDELSPGNDFPLYIFNFGYGDLIGDSETFYIPHQGQLKTLNHFSTVDPITKDLFYGFHSCPLGLVLDKCFEWYLRGNSENETHPVYIDKKGDFFNIGHVTQIKPLKRYLPNGILSVKAGAQTSHVIQNIGCKRSLNRLARSGIHCDAPKTYHDHSDFFKKIYQSCTSENKWHASIVYFSEKWVENILNNPEWININKYFFKYYLHYYAYTYYGDYYQHIFRVAFDKSNLERDFFIQDAAKYIFEILIGEKYGFAFTNTDELLPSTWIKHVLKDIYNLKTEPSIMVPQKHIEKKPVYFSLQHPIFRTYQGLSRKKATLISELEKIYIVSNKYKELFSSKHEEWADTILSEKAEKVQFSYYHGFEHKNSWLSDVNQLIKNDSMINHLNIDDFCQDASFFKGCISITS
ncbi:hypothetical protein OQJ26_11950 [Legionella sp. PATHC038]|uniref:hypothetical protein n=1 Tax=Legionella sheltonii TaxID=2992041 RepID=UPI002243859F|nr:hypothetical protein [Legionella sp. PATHC038]MCW8399504.1 hypothetical protein [Legionella sp. PATHC038]MDX1791242.1 hypothetical protein [Legionella pneumophila]MDX1850387.1 hypothetical protein [Legionella pneumophila]